MTPQQKLLLIGLAGFAGAKFYFKKELAFAITAGLATITVWSLLTAHEDKKPA